MRKEIYPEPRRTSSDLYVLTLSMLKVGGGWGKSLTDPTMKSDCFKRVLALNPHHKGARAMLDGSPVIVAESSTTSTSQPLTETSTPSDHPGSSPRSKAASPRVGIVAGIALGLVTGGLLLAALLLSGALDKAASSLSIALTGSTAPSEGFGPVITLPSTWTPTATLTPAPPTRTPTITVITKTYEQRLIDAKSDIEIAESLTTQGKFAEAVLAWDSVLRVLPEYGEGYYQRARVSLELMGNQRVHSEYRALLDQAYQDIDMAIALSPVVNGDHFYTRFQILDRLAAEEVFTINQTQIWLLALENLQRSLALGNTVPFSEQSLPFAFAALGEGRKGLSETERLIRARGPSAPPSCTLITALAENYEVTEQFSEALRRIDGIVDDCPTARALRDRAWILYNLGRLVEARAQLNEMIEKEPDYGGWRYYLRALISYDQGKFDEAQSDLAVGESQTWYREGIYAYLVGRFALADGDKEGAIELLRYAEATLGIIGTGPFGRRIVRELAALGASPYEITPQVIIPSTPMPTLQPTITPRPLSASSASTPPGTRLVNMTTGIGPQLLRPDDFLALRFQASSRLSFDTIESLTVYLITSSPQGIPTLQVSPWNPKDGGSGLVDSPVWGANPVRNPEMYLTSDGDFFLEIHNWGQKAIQFDNIGIILVVRQKDGTRATYGLGEN